MSVYIDKEIAKTRLQTNVGPRMMGCCFHPTADIALGRLDKIDLWYRYCNTSVSPYPGGRLAARWKQQPSVSVDINIKRSFLLLDRETRMQSIPWRDICLLVNRDAAGPFRGQSVAGNELVL